MATGIKRANRDSEYTPEQLVELAKCQNDPVYFIKTYVKIQHPTKGCVPFELYDYQLDMIDAVHNHKDTILLCSRQLGKTTVVSMYILWWTTFHEDIKAVIASKAMNHATEIMSRIKYAYEELPDWIKAGCKFYNRTSIEFDNGSKIKCEATSEKTGRGDSPTIIFLDEIAFISKRIQDELWASLAPALSTGGKFVLTSTPNGDDELYASLWRGAMSGQNNFFPVKVLWHQHPDRGPEYYEEMKGKLGPVKTRQELDCEFLSSDSLLVDPIKLNQIRGHKPIFEEEEFKFFVSPEELTQIPIFLVGIDPATGSNLDYSVIQVFSFPALEQVAEFRNNKLIIPFLYKKITWILDKLTSIKHKNNMRPEVFWSFERNSIGEAISALYFNDDRQNEFAELVSDEKGKFGMYTSGKTKIQACLRMKTMVEKVNSGITIKSDHLLFELKNFASKGKGYEAKQGATDDAVSATLITIRILDYLSKFNDRAHKVIYDYEYSEADDEPMPFAIV
jgi:hypothetical protein